MNDITALVSVQKSANLHRLSRLIAYAPSDELRQMAVEVEQYTDRLLGALEHYKSREGRVTKLVLDNSVSWEELFKQLEEAKQRNTELVEALEKAQSANTAQDDHINQQQDQIDTLEKRNAELGREVIHLQSLKTVNAARQEAESEFHRGYSCGHKDASLESRTVTVKLPLAWWVKQGPQELLAYEKQMLLDALRAAGIQVIEGEGQHGGNCE